MNIKSLVFGALTIFTLLNITGCEKESSQQDSVTLMEDEGIEVIDPWARPGVEGRMSAAYFLISNFNSEDDVLTTIETDIAQSAEVHESYEREEGMMSMREVPHLDLPAQSTVRFEQGGLHVMLMQLTRQLSDGDTFELTLTFEKSDPITVEVPVRL